MARPVGEALRSVAAQMDESAAITRAAYFEEDKTDPDSAIASMVISTVSDMLAAAFRKLAKELES